MEGKLLHNLKVPELQLQLAARGLDNKGTKQMLAERLSEFIAKNGDDPKAFRFKQIKADPATLLEDSIQSAKENVMSVAGKPASLVERPAPIVEKPAPVTQEVIDIDSEEEIHDQDADDAENGDQAESEEPENSPESEQQMEEQVEQEEDDTESQLEPLKQFTDDNENNNVLTPSNGDEPITSMLNLCEPEDLDYEMDPLPVVEEKPAPAPVVEQLEPSKIGKQVERKSITKSSAGVKDEKPKKDEVVKGLWVGKLKESTKAADLKQYFSKHGKVISASIVMRRGPNGGCFGFLSMQSHDDAVNCIKELNDKDWNGSKLKVELTSREVPSKPVLAKQSSTSNGTSSSKQVKDKKAGGDGSRRSSRSQDRRKAEPSMSTSNLRRGGRVSPLFTAKNRISDESRKPEERPSDVRQILERMRAQRQATSTSRRDEGLIPGKRIFSRRSPLLRSPVRRVERTPPPKRRSPSPLRRRRSRSPPPQSRYARAKTRSPPRRRSPSPQRRFELSSSRRRSRSPQPRRSPILSRRSPMQRRSRTPPPRRDAFIQPLMSVQLNPTRRDQMPPRRRSPSPPPSSSSSRRRYESPVRHREMPQRRMSPAPRYESPPRRRYESPPRRLQPPPSMPVVQPMYTSHQNPSMMPVQSRSRISPPRQGGYNEPSYNSYEMPRGRPSDENKRRRSPYSNDAQMQMSSYRSGAPVGPDRDYHRSSLYEDSSRNRRSPDPGRREMEYHAPRANPIYHPPARSGPPPEWNTPQVVDYGHRTTVGASGPVMNPVMQMRGPPPPQMHHQPIGNYPQDVLALAANLASSLNQQQQMHHVGHSSRHY